jgi:peroxiredoxin family protein
MGKLAIVIRDDSYDRVLTPLAFAHLGAAVYDEVDLFFVSWSAKLLTERGLKEAKVCADHAGTDAVIKAGVRAAGLPDDLYAIIKLMKETGKINLYLCSIAGQVFGATKESAIPELNDVVGATWFLTEKAHHTECFMQF